MRPTSRFTLTSRPLVLISVPPPLGRRPTGTPLRQTRRRPFVIGGTLPYRRTYRNTHNYVRIFPSRQEMLERTRFATGVRATPGAACEAEAGSNKILKIILHLTVLVAVARSPGSRARAPVSNFPPKPAVGVPESALYRESRLGSGDAWWPTSGAGNRPNSSSGIMELANQTSIPRTPPVSSRSTTPPHPFSSRLVGSPSLLDLEEGGVGIGVVVSKFHRAVSSVSARVPPHASRDGPYTGSMTDQIADSGSSVETRRGGASKAAIAVTTGIPASSPSRSRLPAATFIRSRRARARISAVSCQP
jgi:hypothetical protein